MKGSVLALLLAVVLPLTEGEANQYSQQECYNESAVKVSQLFGLRHHRSRKMENVHKLVKEAQAVEDSLNRTLEEIEGIDVDLQNMTTSEISELVALQSCDTSIPRDCCQIKQMFPSVKSGLYTIRDPCLIGDKLFMVSRLTVYCDMETDGGGWIVIQRRNASMGWVDFNRKWEDYEKGFGDLDGEFWIGLKNIYELTNQQHMRLQLSARGQLTQLSVKWNYQHFRINNGRYALSILRGSLGDGGNPFSHSGSSLYYFHTFDYYVGSNNCPYKRQSGWWYLNDNCAENTNLNGRHQPSGLRGTDRVGQRLVWRTPLGYQMFTHSEMKIRPQSCSLN